MAKIYLRKAAVSERYGGITKRTIERMVQDGRLPAPEYPTGRIPLWDEAALEAFERAAARRPLPRSAVPADNRSAQ